ncbi:hypothetical protein [Streptomyces sp. NPDC006996]|uniref:hypothetical protein n=1 Tax=Streptomyces sp. NPDC006996 TaxID=3156908 RepID=UPI0033C51CF8
MISLFAQIPAWLAPFAVLCTGSIAWYVVHRWTADSTRKVRQATLIAAITCLFASTLAVHQWPALARLKVQKAATAHPATAEKASNLKVTSLRNGQCIARAVNVQGSGAIPAGKQIWVGHTNDDKGVPADTLMNLLRADTTGVPGEWQTGSFDIGDERDSRTFWIFVYVLPNEAGAAIKNQLFPDGFRDKDKWPHWQNSLSARFPEEDQLVVYKVYRSVQGC